MLSEIFFNFITTPAVTVGIAIFSVFILLATVVWLTIAVMKR